jgi:ribosomal protection tetracycline resistance protein
VLRRTLNLGILAHVDAGKTTLTERLLYAAGVIDALGSVDKGTTQTDSLALEQRRGITIKSAVASFPVDDVTVNLIDTPGHPDFIAEVERVLNVLDGVVLVVSAVEGVQPQTRVLMRALQRLRLPTLLFVNKLDRRGADAERVLAEIRERLTPAAIAMGAAARAGTRAAAYSPHALEDAAFAAALVDLLAEHDDALLAAYVEDEANVSPGLLREALAAQTGRALVHPVFFGSALTGAGVDALTAGVGELLPAAVGDADAPVSASVFKVERGPAGEKVAYARLFSGTINVRDSVSFRRDGTGEDEGAKVTAVGVFEGGTAVHSQSVTAGEIGKLWGLRAVQIGDTIGAPGPRAPARNAFAPPTLESVVVPRRPEDTAALYLALEQLAEQDPLIDVRRDDQRKELSVSLYGEVQKEVVEATLADDFGVDVEFRETTPIYVERPLGIGEAVEILHAETNPFNAEIGLRVEPAPDSSAVEFRLDVDSRTMPLYVYKTAESFGASMEEYVRRTLQEGLSGWRVTDCVVTMTRCGYSIADGPPSRRGPTSTAADFRKLAPLVLAQALEQARTVVCEPTVRVSLEVPTAVVGALMPALVRLGAVVETPAPKGELSVVEAALPAARADELHRQLPGLTHGEGVLESTFGGYQPVGGDPPTRRRTLPNPFNLQEYRAQLARGVST